MNSYIEVLLLGRTTLRFRMVDVNKAMKCSLRKYKLPVLGDMIATIDRVLEGHRLSFVSQRPERGERVNEILYGDPIPPPNPMGVGWYGSPPSPVHQEGFSLDLQGLGTTTWVSFRASIIVACSSVL